MGKLRPVSRRAMIPSQPARVDEWTAKRLRAPKSPKVLLSYVSVTRPLGEGSVSKGVQAVDRNSELSRECVCEHGSRLNGGYRLIRKTVEVKEMCMCMR